MKKDIDERMLELLAEQAMDGLNLEGLTELEKLEREYPELAGDNSFEIAAAAMQVASLESIEPMPADLLNRIGKQAESYFDAKEEEDSAASTVRNVSFEPAKPSFMQWLGWALAGAACIALVANIWFGVFQRPETLVADGSDKKPPTVSELRNDLIASAGVVRTKWASPQEDLKVEGDVVWSDSEQKGYMTFRGLPVNNTEKETYQLWIFDETQDEATPVDGGVFDVNSDGEAIVEIKAKLDVKGPKAFAVTVEKPGGVVVSKREKIVALAKV